MKSFHNYTAPLAGVLLCFALPVLQAQMSSDASPAPAQPVPSPAMSATPAMGSTMAPPAPAGPMVETLVCIRHGEKPANEIGQINAQGLNRALALPQVLVSKYGKPQFIFAPNPTVKITKENIAYCYLRPLATIEPTAIQLGLPVNTMFGYGALGDLQKELDKPAYANALVYIAWEHIMLERFVKQEVSAHGGDATQVPPWKGSDFDSIYLLKLTHQPDGTVTVAFSLDHEGLDHLSKEFPFPAPNAAAAAQPSSATTP